MLQATFALSKEGTEGSQWVRREGLLHHESYPKIAEKTGLQLWTAQSTASDVSPQWKERTHKALTVLPANFQFWTQEKHCPSAPVRSPKKALFFIIHQSHLGTKFLGMFSPTPYSSPLQLDLWLRRISSIPGTQHSPQGSSQPATKADATTTK